MGQTNGRANGQPKYHDLAGIEAKACAVAGRRRLPVLYVERLAFELTEIRKQAADQYWVNLANSGTKFGKNPNRLVLPWLLGLCDDDPLAGIDQADVFCTSRYKDVVAYIDKHGKLPPGIRRDDDKPDIDIDCLPNARDEIKAYAAKRYGEGINDDIGAVASVVTWSSYLFKQALQDVAFATGWCSKGEALAVTKELPDDVDELKDSGTSKCRGKVVDQETGAERECEFRHGEINCPKCGSPDTEGPTIGKILNENKALAEFNAKYPKVVAFAGRLVGKLRHLGKHAGALIIADRPLYGNVPLTYNSGSDQWVALWSEGHNPQLSKFGYTKWDILGLRTLEYVFECCKLIERNHGISFGNNMVGLEDIDPEDDRRGHYLDRNGKKVKIGLNDPAALRLANQSLTDAVFQFDTDLAKQTLKHGVRSFYDLLIFNAMGHPGPMAMIPDYAERRDDDRQLWRKQEHELVTEVLGETFNTIVYQEQLQQLWQRVAGFTSPEAQEARKAVAKKWKDKLKPVKEKWLAGATKTIGKEAAEAWWPKQETFGRYAFNKSHAVSYVLVAYICLWLKAHFAAEWWTIVMSYCVREKLVRYMNAARSEGMKLSPMDCNQLSLNFDTQGGKPGKDTITVGGTITPGLLSIKSVGAATAEKFVGAGDWQSLDEFVVDRGKGKTVLERLIKLGAFRRLKNHGNSKALWMWYLFKYGSGDDAKAAKEDIKTKIWAEQGWTPEAVEAERQRQQEEFKRQFPKKPVPKKILSWMPKIEADYNKILELYPDDYLLSEQLHFEEEFFGYTIRSPLTLYKIRGGCSIEQAKESGIMEAVVVSKEFSSTKTGKTMLRLVVADGVQTARVIIWEDALAGQDKLTMRKGAGILCLVDYNQKFNSFSLARGAKLQLLEHKANAFRVRAGHKV